MNSSFWMDRALALARLGGAFTAPNPAVGAVLIKDGRLIGAGYHEGPGRPHAEAQALDDAKKRQNDPRGATLYVTLEPCCHEGAGKRTPPCAQRLVAEGIREVFAALPDPNPQVAGRGRLLLQAAGIQFHWGPRSAEARDLVADFAAWIGPHRPYVTLKWAQSLDGHLTGQAPGSRWITGELARAEAHRLRSLHDAVAVGAGTLREDDPALTVRQASVGIRGQPRRLVFAGSQPLPVQARMFTDDHRHLTWVVADPCHPVWTQAGTLVGDRRIAWDGRDFGELGHRLLEAEFYRILIEGGPSLLNSFLHGGQWDRLAVFTAPFLRGGESRLPLDPSSVAEPCWRTVEPDILLEGWNPQAPILASGRSKEAECSLV